MSIILLQPDGVPITAAAERQGSAVLYGGGAGRPLGGRSGFRIDTASDVFTATASAWTLKPCVAMIDPGVNTGMYKWANTSNLTQASIPGSPVAPDATLPRKDIYYVQVNDSTAGDGSGAVSADVKYLAGTPNANPSAPALPARSFLIATVNVPQVGGGAPTVTLNPARFAAAGAPLPIYSQAEADALDKYDGLIIQRRDLPGEPQLTWSTSANAWHGQVWTPYTPSWNGWFNLGPGYVSTGSYMMIGPNLCTVRMKLKAGGAGAALGTGNIAVTLPFVSAPGQSTNGEGQWLGSGPGGGLQKIMLSNPESNIAAAIYSNPSGTAIAQAPGAAGFGYGTPTEVHATITYRTA